ncbi:PREDICTED: uncharacterized protein LOC109181566 [Ipomoea nil]|uniref:uncharacterized protein LOC109181566 n=1 Tax=Ipomoea nil TaxID=35883 RepID=UPI0009019708|nr:PREDICTED: uncharacterized protein LOC109181566 [Ipomoea nil]
MADQTKDCEVTLDSSSQSKAWSSDPRMKCTIRLPNGRPTQILRPAPNGRNSKSCPLKSRFEPRNLSGLKDRGPSQLSGSRPIAQTLTKPSSSIPTPSLKEVLQFADILIHLWQIGAISVSISQ